MTPGAKMMMMRSKRSGGNSNMNYATRSNYGESRYEDPGLRNNEMGNGYEMDSRFRDRRGREHYDNGRFAPKNEWEAYIVGDEMESRGERNRSDGNRGGRSMERRGARNEYPRMNRIGFNTGEEMRSDYGTRVDAPVWNEGESMKGGPMHKGGVSGGGKFDEESAEEWMESLKNADGTTGPHWSKEQVKSVMMQKSVDCDLVELWVAMNMFYSDYVKVAKKMNVNNVNFYLDMAKAFLDDDDAVDDKLAAYYDCIVKHE